MYTYLSSLTLQSISGKYGRSKREIKVNAVATKKSTELKRKLVEVTYSLIEEGGIENVKARRVGDLAGCNPTVIYRYFGSLDYLILVACFGFLSDYLPAILKMREEIEDYVQNFLVSWKIFLEYAFRNPPVYENMFFTKGNADFEDAANDHLELFPEKYKDLDVESVIIYFNGDLADRDYFILRKCALEGRLSNDDAYFLSRVNSFIVHGVLLEHMDDFRKPGVAEAATEETYGMLKRMLEKHLLN